jgi:hypothetical protein
LHLSNFVIFPFFRAAVSFLGTAQPSSLHFLKILLSCSLDSLYRVIGACTLRANKLRIAQWERSDHFFAKKKTKLDCPSAIFFNDSHRSELNY